MRTDIPAAARRAVAGVVAVAATLALAACSSPLGLPVSGAVQTMAPVERHQRRVYTNPQGPRSDAQPEDIVSGFFAAMPAGVQSDGFRVARSFLAQGTARTWNPDASTLVYSGEPSFVRQADEMNLSSRNSVRVQASVQAVGSVDQHGVYDPSRTGVTTLTFELARRSGQWRIEKLEDGAAVGFSDFDQVFRQTSLYRVSAYGNRLVPDVRWFAWRNWRTQAVRELFEDVPAWMGGATRNTNPTGVGLAVDSVPVQEGMTVVRLGEGFDELDGDDRATLVHQIRMTLGDGSPLQELRVVSESGADYSTADADTDLDSRLPSSDLYTLTGGRLVSLGSSSPLRVGVPAGSDTAKGLAFSSSGGALLRDDGAVGCLRSDASSCGTLFDGTPMRTVTAGVDGEIWAIGRDGGSLYVERDGHDIRIPLDWLAGGRAEAMAVSPEGARVAIAVTGGAKPGLRLAGVTRGEDGLPVAVSSAPAAVSSSGDVTMVTFYNDQMLVYAQPATPGENGTRSQRAWRQIGPGPEEMQRLPDTTVVALSGGQIAQYRRLAVLDDLGIVRSVSGSLDGAWSIADSQVTALGSQ